MVALFLNQIRKGKKREKIMNETIKNRRELLFIYDVSNANPNGDPVDDNKPRIDEESGKNLVTDVRLKRTVRDYFYNFKRKEIFVREIGDDDGKIQDAKKRAEDFLYGENKKTLAKKDIKSLNDMINIINGNVLNECIDIRMFGVTLPIEKDNTHKGSITHTGPVQFKMGVSLHSVDTMLIKGTGAFASGEGKSQATFREEYLLPYSLICFYGVVNENAAIHTKLTDGDIELLIEAMWQGTKNLISRSKVGQMPRLLLEIIYKEGENFHIGEVDKLVKLEKKDPQLRDEAIRDVSQVALDMSTLKGRLLREKGRIKTVRQIKDDRVELKGWFEGGEDVTLEQIEFKVNENTHS